MSEFRGRGRGSRSRGGLFRGGPRRGGFSDREGGRGGYGRGRGDGFSRGRGGPPRHLSRDDSPPRKMALMSRGYESERVRAPLIERRSDRYEDDYDRGLPPRSRDAYLSPPRDSGRLMDRLSPPRGSIRERDHGINSRGSGDYASSRGDYLPPRSYTPPRESGSYRDSYNSSMREDRRESFSRPLREYPRSTMDYAGDRSRDFRDSPRDYGSSRDYPPSRMEFRDSLGGREPRERDYSSRPEQRGPPRGPPREYSSRGMRGGYRGRDERGGGGYRGRDERGGRGSFMNGSRGRGGPPRGSRGRPLRRSPPLGRDGPIGKRPRMDDDEEPYSRR